MNSFVASSLFTGALILSLPSLCAEDFPGQTKGRKPAPLIIEKADYSGWELVWNDEFDKDGRPDAGKWNYETGFVRNREPQWYQSQNAHCKDGLLIIEGKREVVPNPRYQAESKDWRLNRKQAEYSSASLTTKQKFSWLYGRFEARVKFNPVEGSWPAFWTVGLKEPWPQRGEIDIMEYYKSHYLANLCWGSKTKGAGQWSTTRTPLARLQESDPDWGKKFHVFRMDWDENFISLYADDILLNRTPLDKTINATYETVKNPFRQPHQIILNLALGGTGGSLEDMQSPRLFEVDYVRVYQRKDSPHKGTIPFEEDGGGSPES